MAVRTRTPDAVTLSFGDPAEHAHDQVMGLIVRLDRAWLLATFDRAWAGGARAAVREN